MVKHKEDYKMKLYWQPWTKKEISQRFSQRDLEVRIGEKVNENSTFNFVVVGIEESIGPLANLGNSGAEFGFEAFCKKFLSMQATADLSFSSVRIAGKIIAQNNAEHLSMYDQRSQISELDQFVEQVLTKEVGLNEIPIIIGGGHNNAFPIIQSSSKKRNHQLSVVNLDAHADYRPLEGRHSGNPFSYAKEAGILDFYAVLHLQKRYNSQVTIDRLHNDGQFFTFHEDYIDGTRNFADDIQWLREKLKKKTHVGVELDLDVIENMPSSAVSSSGISMNEARSYIRKMAQLKNIAYLHLPEGAPQNDIEKNHVGKALAFLVTDFIEVYQKHNITSI